LQQPIGKGTFTVINMCNNAKISDIFHVLQYALEQQN